LRAATKQAIAGSITDAIAIDITVNFH